MFENPAHDFPQRVSYRLAPGGRLLARIEGTHYGVTRGIDFPMQWVGCDAAYSHDETHGGEIAVRMLDFLNRNIER